MNAPVPLRQIAVVADELDLVRILRARIDEMNVSRREFSVEAGLTESYAEKLLCLPPIKYFGPKSFWNVFEQLGYCVIIAEDPKATARYAERMARRDTGKAHRMTRALVMSGRIPWLIKPETARKMAMLANGSMTPKQRKRRARRAAIIRWERVKAAVQSPGKPCSK